MFKEDMLPIKQAELFNGVVTEWLKQNCTTRNTPNKAQQTLNMKYFRNVFMFYNKKDS